MNEIGIREELKSTLKNISKSHRRFLAGSDEILSKICYNSSIEDTNEGLIMYHDFLYELGIKDNIVKKFIKYYSKLEESDYTIEYIDDILPVEDIHIKRTRRTRYAMLTFYSTDDYLNKIIDRAKKIRCVERISGQLFVDNSSKTKIIILYYFIGQRTLKGLSDLIPFESMWDVNLTKKDYDKWKQYLMENSIFGTFTGVQNPDGEDQSWRTEVEKERDRRLRHNKLSRESKKRIRDSLKKEKEILKSSTKSKSYNIKPTNKLSRKNIEAEYKEIERLCGDGNFFMMEPSIKILKGKK